MPESPRPFLHRVTARLALLGLRLLAPRQIVGILTAVLAALLWGCYMQWSRPALLVPGSGVIWVPGPLAGLGLALALALGLAVLGHLAWANRRRWRAVLRPNAGRIWGALILAFVAPIAFMDGMPWILGPTALIMATAGLPTAPLFILAGGVICYPVSALLVSGVKDRWLRFALFCLMFWSALAGILLVQGGGHLSLL